MAAEKDGKALGARIRKYREAAGMSQAALGEMLDVSYQQIQKYERGASRMSVDTLLRLARALQLPLAAFLPAAVPGPGEPWKLSEPRGDYAPVTKEEKDVIKAYRGLPDDKVRAAFLAILQAAASRKH